MNILEITSKLKVTLIPDTLQHAYQSMAYKNLEVDVLHFTDGSIRVTVPEMDQCLDYRTCAIQAFICNMDDLMIVAQVKDVISRLSIAPKNFRLEIISPVYSRYDRVMLNNQTDSFGALVFANFVNSIGFDRVVLFDNHSDVMTLLINNCWSFNQDVLAQKTLGDLFSNYNLVAPDKGAVKKNPDAVIICDKVRDVTNGQITGMEVSKLGNVDLDKPLLIVDDLCEGGRTFIEVAKVLNVVDRPEMMEIVKLPKLLYVTHGIFSNNALDKLTEHYQHVYTHFMKKSTYDQLDESIKEKLTVHTLINV